jgi:DNA-binding ferritin-like protein
MSPKPKTKKEPVMKEQRESAHEASEERESFLNLFAHSLNRIAEIQKRTIDVATQQNKEMLDLYKKSVQKLPAAYRLPLVEVANTMFERFSDAQKQAIDLSVEQSQALMGAMKDRAAAADKATESVVKQSNQAVDRAVAAQKKVLENTVAQTKAAMEAARQHIDLAESPADAALSSFQKGVDKLVETQKQMMDLVTH